MTSDAIDFPTNCPYCGAANEALSKLAEVPPGERKERSMFICAYCAAPAYMEDGNLRLLTLDEARDLLGDRDAIRQVVAISIGGRIDTAPKRLRWVKPDAPQ